jgi:hypothetical protein
MQAHVSALAKIGGRTVQLFACTIPLYFIEEPRRLFGDGFEMNHL